MDGVRYIRLACGWITEVNPPLHRTIGREPDVREDGSHININETIDATVFQRWRADPACRPANLVECHGARRSIPLCYKLPSGLTIPASMRRGPEMYVDEHALGILAGHLVPFTLGELEDWVIVLARHLMNWTVPANNGPPGDDEDERENRPFAWNISYFNFLGILCLALPFARANGSLSR